MKTPAVKPRGTTENPQNGEKGAPSAQGNGAVDETNPNPNGGNGGRNNNQPQLSPEEQKLENQLKQALNKQNPANPGNPNNSPAQRHQLARGQRGKPASGN